MDKECVKIWDSMLFDLGGPADDQCGVAFEIKTSVRTVKDILSFSSHTNYQLDTEGIVI